MSARRFLNTAFGVSNGGLAAWGIAGAGAYYFMYLPEKQRADAEVIRAANAGKLMKQKNYVEFVKAGQPSARGPCQPRKRDQ